MFNISWTKKDKKKTTIIKSVRGINSCFDSDSVVIQRGKVKKPDNFKTGIIQQALHVLDICKASKRKVWVKGSKGKKGYFAFRKLGKAPKKGRFYTPDYVISVPFPPLAHSKKVWSQVAKEVLAAHGNPSGHKDQLMHIFQEIQRKVKSHSNFKEPSRKEKKTIMTVNSIKKNPPEGVDVQISWDAIVDSHLKGKFGSKVTKEEYDSELTGMMAHYKAHIKKHDVSHREDAKKLVKEKKHSKEESSYFHAVMDGMIDHFNRKGKNPFNFKGKEKRKMLDDFYKKADIWDSKKDLDHLNKDVEKLVLRHFKGRSVKKSMFSFRGI